MRYTLRLLTLDQLGRAATPRSAPWSWSGSRTPTRSATWPFEIGLWVGQAATPNRMGARATDAGHGARPRRSPSRTTSRKPSPIPLEECPWCGTKFDAELVRAVARTPTTPTDLRIACANRDCDFSGDQLAADPRRRRADLPPAAVLPDRHGRQVRGACPGPGEVGGFFGGADRHDKARVLRRRASRVAGSRCRRRCRRPT